MKVATLTALSSVQSIAHNESKTLHSSYTSDVLEQRLENYGKHDVAKSYAEHGNSGRHAVLFLEPMANDSLCHSDDLYAGKSS